MSTKRISLVIPIYNVEKYLAKCLDSCIKQDIPTDDYEIIIVNDGTRDGSLEIAERYALFNSNMSIYSQTNSGLSIARNTGLTKASGKYVWFVDSDDWIAENCLAEIVGKMENDSLDMLQVGYYLAYDNGKLEESPRGQFEGCLSGVEAMKKIYLPAPAQFTIYNREFLKRFCLTFYPGIYHEDAEFKPRALYLAKRFACLNKHVYYYFQRPKGSIMNSYNTKRAIDLITVCQSLKSFEQRVQMPQIITKEFDYIISVYLVQLFKGVYKLDLDDRDFIISEIVKAKDIIHCFNNSKNFKHRLFGKLLDVNLKLGMFLLNKL